VTGDADETADRLLVLDAIAAQVRDEDVSLELAGTFGEMVDRVTELLIAAVSVGGRLVVEMAERDGASTADVLDRLRADLLPTPPTGLEDW
jgi:hypothetical protein